MIVNKVTLLGHKDHGKSTLIGSMLMATNSVSEERIKDAKKYSRKLGRKFEPGFILDSFSEERSGGLTIDTSRAQVKYRDSAFEFIDVPGHEELIKNMISGASYASFALLMVSAKRDEGIRPQTKRHIFLAKMLGIGRIIVAVNKMDTVGYDQARFNEIKEELSGFFVRIGIDPKSVRFVPISAYASENLSKRSNRMGWYKGEPLLDVMRYETKQKGVVAQGGATRVLVQGSMEHGSDTLLLGSVVSGTIRSGDQIRIMPSGYGAKVVSIFVKGARKESGKPGENVAMKVDRDVKSPKGMVIYGKESKAIRPVKRFRATVFVVKPVDARAKIKFNGIEVGCRIKATRTIDTTSGEVSGGAHASELNAIDAEIETEKPIAAEPFSSSRELGRFIVYNGREFSGIGTISAVYAR